jgi:hypothetical protein
MPALCRATPESGSGAVSAEELIDRGKTLDAAIEALRVKVKAREADNWQLRRHSVRRAFPSLIFTHLSTSRRLDQLIMPWRGGVCTAQSSFSPKEVSLK